MARGPHGERRPDDPAAAAVLAVRIATGEVEEHLEDTPAERFDAAKQRLTEMQARFAAYMRPPKVESGIKRGEKHSGRTLPIPSSDREPPKRRKK